MPFPNPLKGLFAPKTSPALPPPSAVPTQTTSQTIQDFIKEIQDSLAAIPVAGSPAAGPDTRLVVAGAVQKNALNAWTLQVEFLAKERLGASHYYYPHISRALNDLKAAPTPTRDLLEVLGQTLISCREDIDKGRLPGEQDAQQKEANTKLFDVVMSSNTLYQAISGAILGLFVLKTRILWNHIDLPLLAVIFSGASFLLGALAFMWTIGDLRATSNLRHSVLNLVSVRLLWWQRTTIGLSILVVLIYSITGNILLDSTATGTTTTGTATNTNTATGTGTATNTNTATGTGTTTKTNTATGTGTATNTSTPAGTGTATNTSKRKSP